MDEIFGIAAFRSRQQVLRFESALKRAGVRAGVVATPRDVAVGCGLSVRFDMQNTQDVKKVYMQSQPSNLIGFYRVERGSRDRPSCTRL